MAREKELVSVVVPAYNEAAGIAAFCTSLLKVLSELSTYDFEIIFVDDGSSDNTNEELHRLARLNKRIRLICLSRNFGKEVATTAGIHAAKGNAIITLDADGQHPVELIPDFLRRWKQGTKVVVGIRTANQREGFVKRIGSKLFYKIFNKTTGSKFVPGSTDFRLIDSCVRTEFIRMDERNRITRGLIDWLGYNQGYIEFVANPRLAGKPGYSFRKLFKLAVDSIISSSTSPLFLAAYLGAVITPLSIILLIGMAIDSLMHDPLNLHITGSAYGIVLVLLLAGVLLISQGIIGLYLSHIHIEAKARPLYIINRSESIRL